VRFHKWNGRFSSAKGLRAVAGATPLGVKIGGLDEVQIGRESKTPDVVSLEGLEEFALAGEVEGGISEFPIRGWRARTKSERMKFAILPARGSRTDESAGCCP
ncbi:MAG: hypothetical protein KBT68_07805, partial [bacterium]|nr:hypothetical protein [Candidatus Colisoma equi]